MNGQGKISLGEMTENINKNNASINIDTVRESRSTRKGSIKKEMKSSKGFGAQLRANKLL